MGGELTKADIAKREAGRLRKEFLVKSFKTTSMIKLGISTFNILILGEVASGKSSAVNTFLTAMHDNDEVYLTALSLSLTDANVTPFYKSYYLPEKSGITLFDTWGIYLDQNYLDDSLIRMLDGTMPDGGTEQRSSSPQDKETSPQRAEASITIEQPPSYSSSEASCGREIHMVVFCVSAAKAWAQAADAQQSDFEELGKMAAMIKEIHEKKGICSAILMTCTDTLSPRVLESESPEEIRDLPEVSKRLENVARATGVQKKIVIPMIAQTNEYKRTPIVDYNAIFVLKTLMRIAEGYMEQKVLRRNLGIK